MVLELHIWGPAFGLPSIDPQSLAAVAYLATVLAPDQWILVPAHDCVWSPDGDFPALRDGSERVAGFQEIVEYLKTLGFSLDNSLTQVERADHTALKSHVTTNALPLLDSLLYTTPDSYVHTTRPAWAQILPRSASLSIPPHRQAAAEVRAGSAGITFPSDEVGDLEASSDPDDPQQQQQRAAALHSNSPSLLFARRRTLQASLRKEAAATRFRLDGLIGNLLDPLAVVLNLEESDEEDNFKPTQLHCLAFGYLAIMMYAPVLHPWFAETTKARYPKVVKFVAHMREASFGSKSIDVHDAMTQPVLPGSTISKLPWRLASQPPLTSSLTATLRELVNFIISPAQRWLLFAEPTSRSTSSLSSLPIFGLAAAPPLVTGIAYLVYSTFISASAPATSYWGGGEVDKHFGRPLYANKLEGLGEAGAMLSVLGGY